MNEESYSSCKNVAESFFTQYYILLPVSLTKKNILLLVRMHPSGVTKETQ